MGHQLSGDTKFRYMRLKKTARRRRKARELRGKAAEWDPKARKESI